MDSSNTSTQPVRRGAAVIQLLIVLAACAVLFPAMTPGAATTGGLEVKAFFLGRMVLLIALATWFLHLRGLRWADLGLKRPRWLRFWLSIVGGFVLVLACATGVRLALTRAGVAAPDYSMFAPVKGDLAQYLFWLLPVAWGSAAFGEEMLFRGFVLDALQRLIGGRSWLPTLLAVVLQAVLFGALHIYQGVGGAVTAASIGLALGLVWWMSGRNLWAGIVLHGLIDTVSMTAIYLNGPPR